MNQTAEKSSFRPGDKFAELQVAKRFERGLFGAPKSVGINAVLKAKKALPLGDILYRLGRSPRFHLNNIFDAGLPPELVNMRGRPPESFKGPADPPGEGEEEILFVRGRVVNTGKEPEGFDDAFVFRLKTRFLRFIGSKQIVYGLRPEVRFPLEEQIPAPPAFIGFSVPLDLSELRIGFELFIPRFVGAFLGIAPIIKTRFYLELTPLELRLYLHGEQDRGFPAALEGDVAELGGVLVRNGFEIDLVETLRSAA